MHHADDPVSLFQVEAETELDGDANDTRAIRREAPKQRKRVWGVRSKEMTEHQHHALIYIYGRLLEN